MKAVFYIATILLFVSCNVQNESRNRSNDFNETTVSNDNEGSSVAVSAKRIIRSKCLGCHGDFAELNTNNDFVRKGLVVAGSPSRSKIFIRVSGTSGGSRMPKGQRTLEDSEISDIRFWIEQM